MVIKKMVEAWELSNDDKKIIKENAQKLKTFFVLRNCDDCEEFYGWCNSDDDFLNYIGRILPFAKEEKQYILVDGIQDLIEFINEKYNDKNFIKKILYDDKEFINELLNK